MTITTPLAPTATRVSAEDLASNVRIRLAVPQDRAVEAVEFWLSASEAQQGRSIDRADLAAHDVLFVLDGLADFEWDF